jgi:hypothetical protein
MRRINNGLVIGPGVRNMTKHRWTTEDSGYLTEHYDFGNGLDKCCQHFGLPVNAVKKRAARLGVAGKRRNFSPEEIEYVTENYSTMGPKRIAKVLGTNWMSVYGLANRRLFIKCDPIVKSEATIANNKLWVRTPETRAKIADSRRMLDGVSPLRQIIQNRLYQWRYSVMERDGFACKECGDGEKLNVHHIKRFIVIRQEIFNLFPELAKAPNKNKSILADLIARHHKLDDGTTLCETCHIKEHFGKRGELLGTPEEDNQQPSRSNVINIVGRKVQRLTLADSRSNKSDTSAPLTSIGVMI